MFHVLSHGFWWRRSENGRLPFGPHTSSYYIPISNLMVVGSGVYASGFNHVKQRYFPIFSEIFSRLPH